MKFGAAISTAREGLFYPIGFATPSSFVELVGKTEELGFECIWGNDHITTQEYVRKRGDHPNFFEPMMTFAYLAGFTKRLKFGTAVVMGPTRNPVTLAKQAITLDHLSNGRFILGVGLGAYREEFESFGGVGNRGEMLDEMVEALRLLFESRSPVSFKGKHYRFSKIEMLPRPRSKPLPLYIGGNSEGVLRRVGYYGDGWIPASMSVDDLRTKTETMTSFAVEKGRNPLKIRDRARSHVRGRQSCAEGPGQVPEIPPLRASSLPQRVDPEGLLANRRRLGRPELHRYVRGRSEEAGTLRGVRRHANVVRLRRKDAQGGAESDDAVLKGGNALFLGYETAPSPHY